jgi:serine/threonine protein kinase
MSVSAQQQANSPFQPQQPPQGQHSQQACQQQQHGAQHMQQEAPKKSSSNEVVFAPFQPSQLAAVPPSALPPTCKPAAQGLHDSFNAAGTQISQLLATLMSTVAASAAAVAASVVRQESADQAGALAAAAAAAAVQQLHIQQMQQQPVQVGGSADTQAGAAAAATALLHEAAGQLSSGLARLELQQAGSQHAHPHASAAAAPSPPPPVLQQSQQQQAAEGGRLADEAPGSAVVAPLPAAAAASESAGDKGGSAGQVPSAVSSPKAGPDEDPSLALQRFTEQQLSGRQLRAGQVVRLQRHALAAQTGSRQQGTELSCPTGEELVLRVVQLRGSGATGEVYEVEVLQHVLAASYSCAGQGPPPATEAAAAAAAGPLEGQTLCLKVCRAYSQVPEPLHVFRAVFRADSKLYTSSMERSMVRHHSIMSQLGVPGSNVMCSHMFGKVDVGYGSLVPALLMARASTVSLDVKLQQRSLTPSSIQGFSKQLTHTIMRQILCALYQIHDHGWAYLDLKPANIVGCSSAQHQFDAAATMYKLVDFGSAQDLKGSSHSIVLNLPGTYPYMSPEWVLEGIVSYQADVWALCILLIALRVGQAPYIERFELKGQDPKQQLQPLSSRMAAHTAALQGMKQSPMYATLTQREWAFIDRCLAYDWKQRPTAEHLFEDDNYILSGSF